MVTGQKKMKHFHSSMFLAYLVKRCLLEDREALMNFLNFGFNSFIDLRSSDPYSLRRLSLLSWWGCL